MDTGDFDLAVMLAFLSEKIQPATTKVCNLKEQMKFTVHVSMTQVSLYMLPLLELIWNFSIFQVEWESNSPMKIIKSEVHFAIKNIFDWKWIKTPYGCSFVSKIFFIIKWIKGYCILVWGYMKTQNDQNRTKIRKTKNKNITSVRTT